MRAASACCHVLMAEPTIPSQESAAVLELERFLIPQSEWLRVPFALTSGPHPHCIFSVVQGRDSWVSTSSTASAHRDWLRGVGPLGGRPSSPHVRFALILIVLGFIVLASVVAYETPSWQSSDEPEHVLNIETLVSGHWYRMNMDCRPPPPPTSLLSCSGDEAHQAPLYYALMAGWQELAGLPSEPPPRVFPDTDFLDWLRFGNVLLGAATVVTTFLVAKLVARDSWTPLIASALVAFFPGFIFVTSFVTNDNLVTFLGAVLTYCALRFSDRSATGWMLAAGTVFGLLVTTKLSVIPLALLIPLLALLAPTWRRRWCLFVCGALSALAVSAWYLIQNWIRYGDPLARHDSIVYLTRLGGLGAYFGYPIPYVVRDPLHLIVVDVPNRIVTNWYESHGGGSTGRHQLASSWRVSSLPYSLASSTNESRSGTSSFSAQFRSYRFSASGSSPSRPRLMNLATPLSDLAQWLLCSRSRCGAGRWPYVGCFQLLGSWDV